ncbi:MAG: polysaccharide export protein [Calditrichaeota bacterium]|nr:polysaccharide export protein [Calditrichota bacterium]
MVTQRIKDVRARGSWRGLQGMLGPVMLAAAFLLWWAPASFGQGVAAGSAAAPFGYGDGVRILIWESWERAELQTFATKFSNEYVIDGEGYITLPIFGKLKVVGMTPDGLVEVLREKLRPYTRDPIITVTPLVRVTLLGQFRQPGSYRVDPRDALWSVIEQAGGPGPECDLQRLQLRRGGRTVKKSLLTSWERGSSLAEIGVRSGDVIYAPRVPRLTFRDFVYYFQFIVSLISLYVSIKRWG